MAHGRKFYGVQRALSATNRGAIDDLESFGIYSTKAINTFWAGGTTHVGFNCELFLQRFMALSLLIFNARGGASDRPHGTARYKKLPARRDETREFDDTAL